MNQWIVIKKRTSEPALSFSRAAEGFCRMDCGSVLAFFRKDSRFVNDQVFCADDGSLIISDGVLLNLRELTAQYHAADLRQVIDALCAEDPSAYFSAFIGPFCGAKYDRRTDTLIAYGNQTGDAPVFYFQNERCFMVSNDLNLIEQVMADNHFPRTLDETAAQYLLTFAYMIDDRTLFREIRRLLPGDALMLCGADCKIVPYHRFSFDPLDISMEDAVELVDQKFRKAVDRCFSKDAEYGCPTHLVDLSGGMDSRMTAWVAHDLGYRSNIYINYCQYGSDELRCASRVANELGGQLFYKQLDDASFLYEVDRLIERGGGLSFCFGSTGSDQFLRLLDAAQFGLEHTGQIGDAVLGSFGTQHTELTQSAVESLKYSRTLPFSLDGQFLSRFANYEDFSLQTRAFLGALCSHIIRRHNAYQVSPFLDPEFLQLCESLPMQYREDHKLYYAWVDAKYPRAGQLPSTRVRSAKVQFAKRCRNYAVRKGGRILRRLGLIDKGLVPNNMNPFDYWYETKPELRAFLSSYFDETRPLLQAYPELDAAADTLFRSSRTMDKLLAVNLLAAMKRYFPKS